MSKRVAVILSGCGVFDGAEVHESVLTLLALDEANASYTVVAPDVEQAHVINHHTGKQVTGESRNVLVEAARIARGAVLPLADMRVDEFDAFILPGGFGAAKNLSTFAMEGEACSVLPDLEAKLREAHAAGKPIGFLCIAPAVAARVFGADLHPRLTIGTDENTAKALVGMGAKHVTCTANDIVADASAKIVSTPAYMLASRITEAASGIRKLVAAVLDMA